MAPQHDNSDEASPENSPDLRILAAGASVLFLGGAASGAMLYAFGIAGRQFELSTLRGGLLTFGVIVLLVAAGAGIMSLLIQAIGFLWPQTLRYWSEQRLLRKARQRTHKQLRRRHSLQEERARLTAKMQATLIMEKESARLANQQALQELRSALQSSMVRSCEIVFDHLNRTLDQYQELVDDISSSDLPAPEKKELLDQLTAKLDTGTFDQKNQSARQMMESAIWDVRFQKARMLAKRETAAAVNYLQKIRSRTESHKILLRIDSMIRELKESSEQTI